MPLLYHAGVVALLGLVYSVVRIEQVEAASWATSVLWSCLLFAAGLLAVRLLSSSALGLLRLIGVQPSGMAVFVGQAIAYGFLSLFLLKFAYDQDVAAVLTTSALITAVVGFAMQATLGNVFAGIALQLEKPYGIGDVIGVAGKFGRVININWRSVTLETPLHSRITLPNNIVAGAELEVFTNAQTAASHAIFVDMPSSLPPDQVVKMVSRACRSCPTIDPTKEAEIVVAELLIDRGLVNYRITFVPLDHTTKFGAAAVVHKRLWYALARHGVAWPALALVNRARVENEGDHWLPSTRPEFGIDLRRTGAIVDACELMRRLPAPTRWALGESARILGYGAGEIVDLHDEFGPGWFVVCYGHLSSIPLPAHDLSYDLARFPMAEWPAGGNHRLPRAFIDAAARRLADVVGPAGYRLAEEAAEQTRHPHQYHAILAASIEDQEERARFVIQGAQGDVLQYGAGDTFDTTGKRAQVLYAWAETVFLYWSDHDWSAAVAGEPVDRADAA